MVYIFFRRRRDKANSAKWNAGYQSGIPSSQRSTFAAIRKYANHAFRPLQGHETDSMFTDQIALENITITKRTELDLSVEHQNSEHQFPEGSFNRLDDTHVEDRI